MEAQSTRPIPISVDPRSTSSGRLRGHRRQMPLETVQSLISALDRFEFLDHLVALRGRGKHASNGAQGFAAVVLKGHGYVKLLWIALFGSMGVDEALGFRDFHVDDAVLIVHAVPVHDEAPPPAWLYGDLLSGRREAVRSPPFREVFGIGPRLEHELATCVDDPRDHDLPIRGARGGTICPCGHVSSLSFAGCVNSHPGDRSSAPRSGGSPRASGQAP